MQLFIKNKSFDKNYLIHTTSYEYKNSLDFILELFSKNHFTDREAELYLYQLLKDSAYTSIDEIPHTQLNAIVDYFVDNRQYYKVNYDNEQLCYLLLAAIQAKKIIFSVNNQIITDLMDHIYLKNDSIISFFNLEKLESIKFKSM